MQLPLGSLGFVLATSSWLVSGQQPTAHSHHADGAFRHGNAYAPDVMSIDAAWAGYHNNHHGHSPAHPANLHEGHVKRHMHGTERRAAKDFFLRVMPLGASITEGVGSEKSGHNGYRKLLRSQLRWKGWNVNMVGSKQDGTMADKVSIAKQHKT
jgi:hypothetical protein